MKTQKYILTALIIVLSFNACDVDRLDTEPLDLTEETYFNQKSQFDLAIVQAYSQMIDWYWFRQQNYLHPMYFLPGDDITEPNGVYSTWESFNGIGSNNDFLTYFFESTYQLIQRCNVVIQKTSEAEASDFPDPFLDLTFLDHQRGEALFLRSLANFQLFNMYGTAPIVTERLGDETMHTPRSTGTELLDQAITDLQTAAELLPPSWDEENRGRATKNSAYGLLVKCLVFRGDYNNSTADYTAAVAAYQNITATLTEDYTDNFSAFEENNEESIFEFQASANANQDNVWLYNDGPWRGVEVMSTYWGFYSNQAGPALSNRRGDQWRVTRKMFNAYGNDPRIAFFTNADRGFTKYGKEGLDELAPGGYIPSSMNNVRILRYADIQLLAAEAILLSGGSTSEAISLINGVRERARNWAQTEGFTDLSMLEDRDESQTDQAVIMRWIEEERIAELLGEQQIRWFDLKRWDARGYKNLEGWTGSDEHFSTDLPGSFGFEYPKHLLLPIPFNEVSRNNSINDNNPGY